MSEPSAIVESMRPLLFGRARAWAASLLVAALFLSGCTGGKKGPNPPPPGAPQAAAAIAQALHSGKWDEVAMTSDKASAQTDYKQVTGAMDGLLPTVQVGDITYDGDRASVKLNQTYTFENGTWAFTSVANLAFDEAGGWQLVWSPSIVHPQLTPTTRLVHQRTPGKRGTIVDRNGKAIVEDRPVFEVGIDKTKVDPTQAPASASALAKLFKIDEKTYVQQVSDSGPQAFVLAITLRAGQVPPQIDSIAGAAAFGTTLPLAPTASFARPILGVVGKATAEDIAKSDGKIVAGDLVGHSGLQMSHDTQLRGTPGHSVNLAKRTKDQLASAPAPPPSSRSPEASSSPQASLPQTLFAVAPVNGQPLQLTMDLDLQTRLEEEMAKRSGNVVATLVEPDSGAILATAASPVGDDQALSLVGAYEPGSTMKVISSLALLRRGMTPDSPVNCSDGASVNGRVFQNFPGFPKDVNGMMPLRNALAWSCNTAFVNSHLTTEELASAAASLGVGVDYDAGFNMFYGSIPQTSDPVTAAADSFGQGQVLVSVTAMAGVSASVKAAKTVIPHLIAGQPPTPQGKPLTVDEANALADMMRGVVSGPLGGGYQQYLLADKTGTAEFMREGKLRTHIWITGFTDKYALSIMDFDSDNTQQIFEVLKALLK